MIGVPKRDLRNTARTPIHRLPDQRAFTLVELLVVLALTAIAMAIIYKTVPTQNKIFVVQDQVVEMQQQLRAAMAVVVREIRMAGYNPKSCLDSSCGCSPGILTATADSICLTKDITGGQTDTLDNDGDGITDEAGEEVYPDGDCKDPNETVTLAIDTNSIGKPCLRRKSSAAGSFQTIAENIEILNFVYLDRNGVVLATPLTSADLPKVRSIQVAMVARTEREDKQYHNTTVFRNRQQDILLSASGDGYRRRLLNTTVQCHNMEFSEDAGH